MTLRQRQPQQRAIADCLAQSFWLSSFGVLGMVEGCWPRVDQSAAGVAVEAPSIRKAEAAAAESASGCRGRPKTYVLALSTQNPAQEGGGRRRPGQI